MGVPGSAFIKGQLRGIVGGRMTVSHIEAKDAFGSRAEELDAFLAFVAESRHADIA